MEAWRPTVEALTDDLVAGVAGREEVDVILDLAYPLPAMVIAEVFGLPRQDWDHFRAWTRALAPALDEHAGTMGGANARRALLAFTEYFEDVIRHRRRHPRSDLFTQVTHAAEPAGLSDDELVANVAFVFLAGQESVQHLVGNSLMALWTHPDQLRRLQADPALIGSAVEELARFDTPVQLTSRLALDDVEVGDRIIRRGQKVLLSIGAANRDPAKFDDPATLDITRAPNPHLAFSSGPHYCLGAALARLEARAMLGAILRRYPDIALTGPPPVRFDHFLVRGYQALPVVLGRSAVTPVASVSQGSPPPAAVGR
jgi:cytochrome P450